MPSAYGVYNGTQAVGDTRVVALVDGINSSKPFCSGSLINKQIVVSAAHCLGNSGMKYKSEVFTPKNIWISLPGSNLNLDQKSKRVKVLRVLLTNGYDNTLDPKSGNILTQKDDIAFYLLEKPIVDKYSIEIATKDEIKLIKQNRLLITHIGYGLQDENILNGKPYLVKLNSFTNGSERYSYNPALESNTLASEETGYQALCGGDSGSPWYATINGIEKIVAITVGGSGCTGPNSGSNGTFGTAIYPYMYLVENHFEQYLKDQRAARCMKLKKCYNRSMDGILEPSK
jgi:secreted trypsin-like serine protease